jgi:HK97 family phage prohead protease
MSQQLEYRAATVTATSYPNRTIDLIVMPYEREAVVEFRGRMVREIVSRGAFDGIQNRPDRVKLNRDHDVTRTCGHAVRFHPSHDDGLIAEVKVSRTELGNETLELAADGDLGASAGFLPLLREDGSFEEEWPEKNLRRLNKVWLGHIAMTPVPAYEDAQVLAVRSAVQALTERESGHRPRRGYNVVVARPNLEKVRAVILQDAYDSLSR